MIKVLIADDSNYMRTLISRVLGSDDRIDVIGSAKDGIEAIELVGSLRPDVVTMDINMPHMDGLEAVKGIMEKFPTPIIMVSAHTKKGAGSTIRALEYGAVDFIEKPGGEVSVNLEPIKSDLIKKVKVAAIARVRMQMREGRRERGERRIDDSVRAIHELPLHRTPSSELVKVVVIGSSTGGPGVVVDILNEFSSDITAGILVIQHMPKKYTGEFATRLNKTSNIEVKEASEGDSIESGLALVAPGGFNVLLTKTGKVKIDTANSDSLFIPSVDITMKEVARLYREDSIGVVLTGIGNDGTEGLKSIKTAGGITIAQDEESSVVFGMPKSAIMHGVVDKVVPSDKIAREIIKLVRSAHNWNNGMVE